ncbi:MAG TPA: undecaprenyl-diphosphate phosphatase [Gaiellaceae bacterium]|jgi:undecaprenyl-diphosphatase|nr:undecaprenyl-diphosphate phosphatase [Gaiellaceae bacterium]
MRRAGILAVAGAAMLAAVGLTLARVGEEPGALPDWQALVLGIVQGATELLPISSSGHLILVPWLFDWDYLEAHEDFNQTFDVALHVGTLVAVVAYFRADLAALLRALVRSARKRRVEADDERAAWFVAVATVPAAVIGALGEELIAEHLGEPWQIAIFLAVFGVVLWFADRTPPRRRMSDLGPGTAVAVGLAQSLALMPGVSRSGITITAARFLGLDRDSAARVSFLLLVPIVFGASLWKGVTDVLLGDLPPGYVGPFVVGMLASAGSGLLAIWGLLGYVRRHDYSLFVVYRLVAAVFVFLVIATNVRPSTF